MGTAFGVLAIIALVFLGSFLGSEARKRTALECARIKRAYASGNKRAVAAIEKSLEKKPETPAAKHLKDEVAYPLANVDGTAMIPGTWTDVHGNAFGITDTNTHRPS